MRKRRLCHSDTTLIPSGIKTLCSLVLLIKGKKNTHIEIELIMAAINNLPREILVHIFSFLKITQRDLINIANVCPYWEEVCMDNSFWHTFDGTLPLIYLKKYCKNGFLRNTESLVFSNCKKISSKELTLIFENLPRLKCINCTNIIEHFKKRDYSFFSDLINHCPNLNEIIFLETSSQNLPPIPVSSFTNFIKIRGFNLISLDFSNLCIPAFKDLFISIATSCPNLESLKAQNLIGFNYPFPIQLMQNGLKKLKVLRLGHPIIMQNCSSMTTIGFPNLETFTHPSKSDCFINDSQFQKLLMESPNLKVLDIRGCQLLTSGALHSLPCNGLERLYVSCTRLYELPGFVDILKKWGHSLIALDISKMKGNSINHLLKSLFSCGSLQNLEILDLNHTAVTPFTVKLIVQNCSKLNFIQLESCRSLGRGQKHAYYGQVEIKQLLNLDFVEEMEVT